MPMVFDFGGNLPTVAVQLDNIYSNIEDYDHTDRH